HPLLIALTRDNARTLFLRNSHSRLSTYSLHLPPRVAAANEDYPQSPKRLLQIAKVPHRRSIRHRAPGVGRRRTPFMMEALRSSHRRPKSFRPTFAPAALLLSMANPRS